MSGGSRYGAGRPAHRPCESAYRSVDIRRFAREGMLNRPGRHGWCWYNDDLGTVATIRLYVDNVARFIRFEYRETIAGRSRDVRIAAWTETTPCNFGGVRWWFRCPNCRRRCARLFIVNRGMGCLVCLRMAYASQREDSIGRSWRRTQKIEVALGSPS